MTRRYDPRPSYPVSGGTVEPGLPPLPRGVLAIDGPAALPWERLLAALPVRDAVDVRDSLLPWEEVERRTGGTTDDPVFRRLCDRELAGLFGELPGVEGDAVVFGPGAALVPHDELWYADLPKRHALAAVRRGEAPNAGQRAGTRGTEPRLLFVNWPLLDSYKQELLPSIDRYLDLSHPDAHSPTQSRLARAHRSLGRDPPAHADAERRPRGLRLDGEATRFARDHVPRRGEGRPSRGRTHRIRGRRRPARRSPDRRAAAPRTRSRFRKRPHRTARLDCRRLRDTRDVPSPRVRGRRRDAHPAFQRTSAAEGRGHGEAARTPRRPGNRGRDFRKRASEPIRRRAERADEKADFEHEHLTHWFGE